MTNVYMTGKKNLVLPEFTSGLGAHRGTGFAIEENDNAAKFKLPRLVLACVVGAVSSFTLSPASAFSENSSGRVRDIRYYLYDAAEKYVVENEAFSSKEYASLISTELGLGKSDVARILGVSRPTLYSWIKGESEPENPDRLYALGEMTRKIAGDIKRPLYYRFVEEPLPGQSLSILDLLKLKDWDEQRLVILLSEARRLTTERDARLGIDLASQSSNAEYEQNLTDNSVAMGLE